MPSFLLEPQSGEEPLGRAGQQPRANMEQLFDKITESFQKECPDNVCLQFDKFLKNLNSIFDVNLPGQSRHVLGCDILISF